MTDIDLKTETPDTTLPTTGFLFGADSQASGSPSVYTVQSVATTLLGSTTLTGAPPISADAPVLNLAQTWNNAAVTFTGLKLNATDTASASGSLLLDIGTGGGTYASKFKVDKNGYVTFGTSGTSSLPNISSPGALSFYAPNPNIFAFISTLGNFAVTIDPNRPGLTLHNNYFLAFSSNNGAPDLFLTRRGERNLRFGSADVATALAQTLSVQSVVAGTTNTAGANLTITGSQGTGTGAGGSIIFQVAPAGSSGTAQNALSTALTIGSDRSITASSNMIATGNMVATGFYPGAGADTGIVRDTSNTLAQRNANNGQIFRLYGRFTDITNDFERFFINAPTTSGDAVQLGTQKGATTGAARALELQTDATTRLTIAATSGNITTTGSVTTQAPTGGTAAAWRLGTVATVTPTLQNRTIEVDIGGTIYYISAKTTND